ncbi:hypothetical protein GEV33_015147 [Tenebrio molitor]|nr:hypothetical protein GEV33_015147 [Tenebrio molitor]
MCLCVHKALNDSDGDAVSLSVGTAEWMAPFLIYGKRGRRLHGEVCGAARIRPIRTWVSRHGPVRRETPKTNVRKNQTPKLESAKRIDLVPKSSLRSKYLSSGVTPPPSTPVPIIDNEASAEGVSDPLIPLHNGKARRSVFKDLLYPRHSRHLRSARREIQTRIGTPATPIFQPTSSRPKGQFGFTARETCKDQCDVSVRRFRPVRRCGGPAAIMGSSEMASSRRKAHGGGRRWALALPCLYLLCSSLTPAGGERLRHRRPDDDVYVRQLEDALEEGGKAACPNCVYKNAEADGLRLEAIKRQILTKLGLRHKPNVTHSLPKEVIMETLSRAEDNSDFLRNSNSEENVATTSARTATAEAMDFDDFYGRTSEIISFAEQGRDAVLLSTPLDDAPLYTVAPFNFNQPDTSSDSRNPTTFTISSRDSHMYKNNMGAWWTVGGVSDRRRLPYTLNVAEREGEIKENDNIRSHSVHAQWRASMNGRKQPRAATAAATPIKRTAELN